MTNNTFFPIPADVAAIAWIDEATYTRMYQQSITDPESFWNEHGRRISWIKPYTKIKEGSYTPPYDIAWFSDGTLNASYNCLDRHLPTDGDRTAIVWESDDPNEHRLISYREAYEQVCRLANVLKSYGVKKGDRVTIYLPMIPEAAFAMLACSRIGAVHSVVFAGFSPESLKDRILDCDASFVITADEGVRGGRKVPLKDNTDQAIKACPNVRHVLIVKHTGADIVWNDGRDLWYHEAMSPASPECSPVEMNAEDPLFILYTSGSTGKPKGVLHTTGGYMVWASMTHEYIFDYHKDDIYWCTADLGWVTGHSYILYGPLANCATTLIFEGVPNYPDFSRFWQVVDKHKVTIFYTAPTAIRTLMREGERPVKKQSRASLRLLGTVGEPINPEAWLWYHRVIGDGRCPIMDTWWQTETGGIVITPLAGAMGLKPGSSAKPFFGIQPALIDNDGQVIEGVGEGNLCLLDSWPGQMRTVFGDHERFIATYFSLFPGKYFSGDGCRRDEDGYYWITGRVDDVINVSGHRLGTAEIESALVKHPSVAEAAVVGYPHVLKGQGIYAYVTLTVEAQPSDALSDELIQWVRREIGALATPDLIQWAPGLPKTRSGKIMRRILRKIASNAHDQLGDTSTLADPSIVNDLVNNRINR